MIIYDLICQQGHKFEGWFPSLAEFSAQRGNGFVECPVCGETEIRKVPSGGHTLHSPSPQTPVLQPAPLKETAPTKNETAALGQLDPVTLVKAVRHYVKTNFENVGKDFADKAIQMQKGEIPKKDIYGQTTSQDEKRLAEADIPHFVLPNLPPEYDN